MPLSCSNTESPSNNLEAIAYREIRNAIITGIFPPRYHIVEEHISNQLNMSRSPVRGTIKRLQTEGFLEKHSNNRIYVSMPDSNTLIDTLYIRMALDGITANRAAVNRTQEDVILIEQTLHQSTEALKADDTFLQHELAVSIHHTIYNATKSDLLSRLAKNYENQVTVFTYNSLKQEPTRSAVAFEEHLAICQCVIDQKPKEAEEAARAHIQKLIDRVKLVEQKVEAISSLSRLLP